MRGKLQSKGCSPFVSTKFLRRSFSEGEESREGRFFGMTRRMGEEIERRNTYKVRKREKKIS